MLRIAIPNKGRLADQALELLELAGLAADLKHQRALQATLGDGAFQALFVRAADIAEFVADGAADLGITGSDLVAEGGRAVVPILDLQFGRCRLVVAVKEESDIQATSDIAPGARVATSFPNSARGFFEAAGVAITSIPVTGATEIAPLLGVADIIVDLVSTGSTLRSNGLREIATILESSATLITTERVLADPGRAPAARELTVALQSVIAARDRRYLMANVPRSVIAQLTEILPGLNGPTIVEVLNGGEHVATHAVVEQQAVYRVIARLREIGATGILVTRIERLMV